MSSVTPIKPGMKQPEPTETVADLVNEAYCVLDQTWAIVAMLQTLMENDDGEPHDGLYANTTYALQTMIRNAQAILVRPLKVKSAT